MTVPSLLAAAPAAAADPALPGLAAALSASPPGTAAGDDCRVRSVEWLPRRRCRVVHEVRSPGRPAALLCCEVTPTGTVVRGPADDADLPGLAVALDPDGVRDRLAAVAGRPVEVLEVTPVAWRPGARAVVAYDLATGSGRTTLYAKLLAEGPDRYAAAAAALTASARGRGTPAPVPEVVAVWRDLGAVVQRAAPGRVLSDVLRDGSLPEGERLAATGRLGRLLADVHAAPADGLPPWGAPDELAALEALLPAAWHADPAAGRSLASVVDRLADAAPAEADPVLAHGAFRTGQVLLDGGRAVLLDLDTGGRSDAARDAGNALAYLAWAEARGALPAGLAKGLRPAFLAGYAEARTPPGRTALAWWSAAAMAKIAGRRFRTLSTAEWRSVPDLLTRAAAQLVAAGAAGGGAGTAARPQPAPEADPSDTDGMTAVLRAEPSLRAPGPVRVISARTLAESAGRRCVVRYLVEGLDPDRPVPLIGKLHTDRHRSWLAHENLRLLAEVFAATPQLGVPARVCHLPELRMVLYREVPGTAVDRLPGSAAVAAAGLAGRWLATLHGSAAVLGRRLDLAHEVVDVEEWAARVGAALPDARAAASALAGRLAAAAAELPAAPEVPVHRDLHAGHALAVGDGPGGSGAGSGVAVIDLDEARMGDPALDVAHFTTYLDVAAAPAARGVREAFLDGYGPLPGPSPDVRTAFFTAHTCMKIAKQLVTRRGPLTAPPGPARSAAVQAVLRKGAACLDG
ncbi:phosphotransferase [Geodermatophilus sp. YIM 151500]|uniref:phosphotransferase family protein n=1 Tax=Geodermatophilus sp. YIM 151500 TaxID=2984531 RepID=UPI0021E41B28|nr:phosphotransferase [Geodermatophilus sp. YIM 151500]MCV2491798.1 phosphotransferase [Geodermatophilus sp. YIM 151500]